MSPEQFRNANYQGELAFRRVLALTLAVVLLMALSPILINAEENPALSTEGALGSMLSDGSGGETEETVQPSGGQQEIMPPSAGENEEAIQPSGELPEIMPPSAGGTEEMISESVGKPEFQLPPIETPEFGEEVSLSPAEQEGILALRPQDQYYQDLVRNAPAPDITMLGPLPKVQEEGVEFTDVAADWIYYQKSAGMTELKGHVMIIYDTTIISCDEAKLDEKNEIYRFFGEGRVFVDDADFTLECDEMEIHDADAEKTIYIKGSSTMVVYADKTAEAPGENATRRQRLEYALKQQDTTITFTDAEYNYDKEIFDAHGHVKFEQSDKYAQGDEFHGENKNEYALFKGACEFWQQNGLWLYEYKVVEDKEDPPSRGDKITRALLSVPSTITCDEAEGNSKDGWMQLRSLEGNIVYFKQDDKHAECRKFSLWYTEEEKEGEGQNEPEGPRDLLQPVEPEPEPEPAEPPTPRGFGSLPLLSDFPPDYVPPWQMSGGQPEPSVQMSSGETVEDAVQPSSGETEPEVEYPTSAGDVEDIVKSIETAGLSQAPADEGSPPETTPEIPAAQDYSFEFPEGETTPSGGTVGNLAELGGRIGEVTAEESGQESTAPHNEILMEGDVFVRQENGDWLFTYDIVREEDETKESIEQYKKWANASADSIHAWLDDNDVEATGSVKGEQDNQDLATDYLKYIGEFDMAYLRGNITVHREGKHQLMSQEGFIFFSTDIFEALGNVETKVIVDVEQQRSEAQGGTSEGQATAPAEGGETTPTPAPEGGGSTGGAPSG